MPSFRDIIPQNINVNNFNDNINQEYKEKEQENGNINIENNSEVIVNNSITSLDNKSIIKVSGLSQIVLNDFNSKNNNEGILKDRDNGKNNSPQANQIIPSFQEDNKTNNNNNNINSNQNGNSDNKSIIFVPTLSQVFRQENNK